MRAFSGNSVLWWVHAIALLGILAVLGAGAAGARADDSGELRAQLAGLVGSQTGSKVDERILGEVTSPKHRASWKRLLRQGGRRLSRYQGSLIRLGLRFSSPNSVALWRKMRRGERLDARALDALIALIRTFARAPAMKATVARGDFLRRHPSVLEAEVLALKAPIERATRGSEPPLYAAGTIAVLGSPVLQRYARKLPPLALGLVLRNRGGKSSVHARSSAGSDAGQTAGWKKLASDAMALAGNWISNATTSISDYFTQHADLKAMLERQATKEGLGATIKGYFGSIGSVGLPAEIAVKELLLRLFCQVDTLARLTPTVVEEILGTASVPGKPANPGPGLPYCPQTRRFATARTLTAESCTAAEPTTIEIRSPAARPDALEPAVPGVAYSQALAAQGGVGSLQWGASGLPAGLYIDPQTGEIRGWTQHLGGSQVEITVEDSVGDRGSAVLALSSEPPSCSGNPCAIAYGNSEVTVAWACGCVNPFPTEFHGVFGYYLEPIVNGVPGGHVGTPFVLGPLNVNAPDGSEGVPVFTGPGGLLWYTYPHVAADPHFSQAPPDAMALKVYFIAERNSDGEPVAFPIGTSNTVAVR